MALLMLSLIKSMLVVKLLHHNDKDVKQMSLSACLLDRYGSGGQEVTASALTSIRTLDSVDPSHGELHGVHQSGKTLQHFYLGVFCMQLYFCPCTTSIDKASLFPRIRAGDVPGGGPGVPE